MLLGNLLLTPTPGIFGIQNMSHENLFWESDHVRLVSEVNTQPQLNAPHALPIDPIASKIGKITTLQSHN